jgi:hypothetical protein
MVDIFEPQYVQWPDLLAANLSSRASRAAILGKERVERIRSQVVAKALSYTQNLVDLARSKGLSAIKPLSCDFNLDTPIVMAGHQPVIYHPGLLLKLQALKRISIDTPALPIQVITDTDEGDAGLINWPRVAVGQLEIKRTSLSEVRDGNSLHSGCRVASAQKISDLFCEIVADLDRSGLSDAAKRAKEVQWAYEALAGESLIEANSIIRSLFSDTAILEVPLSILLTETELRDVIGEFFVDSNRLVATYNLTLDNYRKEHRIINPANPFPNMKVDSLGAELPLWNIRDGRRSPVFSRTDELKEDSHCNYLVTRGSITTLLLRAYCSDLFVHGLGGGKYDRFVEQFSAAYYGLTLPNFVVASRTAALFPEKLAQLNRDIELASNVKDMISKTEAYLGRNIFTEGEELHLGELIAERNKLRVELQQVSDQEQRGGIARKLNEANRQVRLIIEQGSLKSVIVNAAANEVLLAKWGFREFPFFFYH